MIGMLLADPALVPGTPLLVRSGGFEHQPTVIAGTPQDVVAYRRVFKIHALLGEVHMTDAEVQARSILAAALIQSGSIDVNNTNLATDWRLQPNTERLHHLVDLLYRAITETRE
jgi:hypothetical protein